ncbi:MAG TPA: hypothetical protein DEF88_12325 [Porphyromonadaceae bacterium]|jgi:hypothetical protein|nr:hypothetical protein [Porphyromonadaceae bacterium]HBX21223.1 hypothetical protein [Porphyromonadaceae bacterium]HCM20601.1 hypothetical protein [Porphyromonadaceae bacterium]
MKYIFKYLLTGVLLAVLAAACTSEDFQSPTNNDEDAVIITAGTFLSADAESKTRATIENTWEPNDRIGITMLSTETSKVVDSYTNRDYVTTGGDGEFVSNPEANKMYYPINGSEVTFKAYYPYTGLNDYPNYPLDVSGQATLANLDLMTSVHENKDDKSAANSKNKKEAHLVFHHRLTLVTVNLLTEDSSPIVLDNHTKLVIKGMKTTGQYNLLTDALTTNVESVQDIEIPLSSSHVGRGILLPREAAEGVTFEVRLANGGVYTAKMATDLDLKGGFKYTFNLKLTTTPTLITAEIKDWDDGATRDYDVIHVVTTQGENEGFKTDDQLKLYVKDKEDTDYSFSKGGTFTFDGMKWGIATPIYWENLTGPTYFRATSVFAGKLNNTQMDDYLVGQTTGVVLYQGVHLDMKHVGTKVTVKLQSNDGTYSATDLESATVTLPQYLNSGSLNETTGAYAVGTGRGNITPEAPGTTERVAIFPAQTIKAGTTLVKVFINGHTYEVLHKENNTNTDFTFESGKQHVITLNILKSGVKITTKLIDWEDGNTYEANEVRIGKPTLGDNENIPDGSVLKLFTEEIPGAERLDVRGHFTYNSNTWSYSEQTKLFWEELPNIGKIYASIENAAVNGTEGYNQSKDYIVATPVENKGGVGNTAIHFEMKHAVSQVEVVLRPSDTYTAEQLKDAEITLPGYKYDGGLNKGVYVPGTKTGEVKLDKPNNTEILTRTYLQAQTIATGQTVARMKIGTRTYNVTYDHYVVYNAGEITHLYITIKGSELLVSVKVTDWQDQTPVELTYSFNQKDPTVEGFEDNEIIRFYDLGQSTTVTDNKNYFVKTDGGKKVLEAQDGTPWYRDDFANGDKIVAVFPAPNTVPGVVSGANTFNWNMNDKSNPIRENDVLVTNNGVIKDRDANVDLTFNHVLSKVTVNIISGQGFEPNEIKDGNPSIQLVDFMQQGVVNISTGGVTSISNSLSFTPASIPANTGIVVSPGVTKDAELSYQALILPQTKSADPVLVKVTLSGIVYDAKWTGSFEFKPGQHHVLNITLAKTDLKLSAKIAEWVTGDNGSIIIK